MQRITSTPKPSKYLANRVSPLLLLRVAVLTLASLLMAGCFGATTPPPDDWGELVAEDSRSIDGYYDMLCQTRFGGKTYFEPIITDLNRFFPLTVDRPGYRPETHPRYWRYLRVTAKEKTVEIAVISEEGDLKGNIELRMYRHEGWYAVDSSEVPRRIRQSGVDSQLTDFRLGLTKKGNLKMEIAAGTAGFVLTGPSSYNQFSRCERVSEKVAARLEAVRDKK